MVHLTGISTFAAGNTASSRRPTKPPGLLVSVRSAAETRALAGLDLTVLDIKEPSAGALAAASPEVWAAIVEENSKSSKPWRLSVALGECDEALELAPKVPAAIDFAKAGPARTRDLMTLQISWQTLRERLDASTELVAVAYADHAKACCPAPESIFELAAQVGLKTWLIDTFEKSGSSSLDHLNESRLRDLANRAAAAGAQWVLAGSVRCSMLARLERMGVQPDLFGVRGDVCDRSREGVVVREKVASWLVTLQETRI